MINDFIHVNDVSKFILSHLNKIKENLEYDVGSGYGLKVLDIMNFYKKIDKDKNNKIRKYTKCFKANIPNNKLKIKIDKNKNLKLMMY